MHNDGLTVNVASSNGKMRHKNDFGRIWFPVILRAHQKRRSVNRIIRRHRSLNRRRRKSRGWGMAVIMRPFNWNARPIEARARAARRRLLSFRTVSGSSARSMYMQGGVVPFYPWWCDTCRVKKRLSDVFLAYCYIFVIRIISDYLYFHFVRHRRCLLRLCSEPHMKDMLPRICLCILCAFLCAAVSRANGPNPPSLPTTTAATDGTLQISPAVNTTSHDMWVFIPFYI